MSDFKGKAGRIYVNEADNADDHRYDVWFEDFCIIGTGDSELQALEDAARHVKDIGTLVNEALVAVNAAAALEASSA